MLLCAPESGGAASALRLLQETEQERTDHLAALHVEGMPCPLIRPLTPWRFRGPCGAMQEDVSCTLSSVDQGRSLRLPAVQVTATLGDGRKITVPLDLHPCVVGTSPECDLVLSGGHISRRHCELRLTERGILLRDLGSKNGTLVRGLAVVEAWLTIYPSCRAGRAQIGEAAIPRRRHGVTFTRQPPSRDGDRHLQACFNFGSPEEQPWCQVAGAPPPRAPCEGAAISRPRVSRGRVS